MSINDQIGSEREDTFEVEGSLVTDVGGTLPARVLSTPGMIGMMETTSARLVAPHLDQNRATVGFEVSIKHVAASFQGAECTAWARLDEVVDDRKLRLSIEVREGDRTIGVGTHERRVIEVPGPGDPAP